MKKTNQSMETNPEMTDDGINSQVLNNSYYNCIYKYRNLGERVACELELIYQKDKNSTMRK